MACALAHTALVAEREHGETRDVGRLSLLLAGVMKEAGRWNAARQFAEQAISLRVLSAEDHVQALFLIASDKEFRLHQIEGNVDPTVVIEVLGGTPESEIGGGNWERDARIAVFLVRDCHLSPDDTRLRGVIRTLARIAELPVRIESWLEGDNVMRTETGDVNEPDRIHAAAYLEQLRAQRR